ncbi:M23 family metallopeptidase [Anaerolinea thermophila]|nr:M23 family metallopeptidase [Anaerolinea thermophila]
MRKVLLVFLILAGFAAAVLGAWAVRRTAQGGSLRDERVISFIRSPKLHADWVLEAGTRCADAPFRMPTRGFIGYVWGDSFRPGHHHSGLDIFGGTAPGETPVYAAYSGYLTRLPEWRSTVIIRIPSDPLQPERQIWTYYTHLADPQGNSLIDAAFPPGTQDVFVEAGTLLGFQGNFSGTPGAPVGVHLHFSIVRDDGEGHFLDEREMENTLDPSPYFGMTLNAEGLGMGIPACLPSAP